MRGGSIREPQPPPDPHSTGRFAAGDQRGSQSRRRMHKPLSRAPLRAVSPRPASLSLRRAAVKGAFAPRRRPPRRIRRARLAPARWRRRRSPVFCCSSLTSQTMPVDRRSLRALVFFRLVAMMALAANAARATPPHRLRGDAQPRFRAHDSAASICSDKSSHASSAATSARSSSARLPARSMILAGSPPSAPA